MSLSRKAAATIGNNLTADLIRIAAEVERYASVLGVPANVARSFGARAAALADSIDAGVAGRFDASTIGIIKKPTMVERTSPDDDVIDIFDQDENSDVRTMYESTTRTAAREVAAQYMRQLRR